MLDTRFPDSKARERYIVQWVTNQNQTDMQVLGYCVRDMDTFNGDTLFHHKEKSVCEKVRDMLNEGANKC
jgi:hypothetical protein